MRLITTIATDERRIDQFGELLRAAVGGLLLFGRRQVGRPFTLGHRQDLAVFLRADVLAKSRFLIRDDLFVADLTDQLVVLQNDAILSEMANPLLVQRTLRKRFVRLGIGRGQSTIVHDSKVSTQYYRGIEFAK